MKSLEREATLSPRVGTAYADKEKPQRAEVVREEKKVVEKPKVSEEIMIEEINIDGMCGVY